jgi:hypothetical protein
MDVFDTSKPCVILDTGVIRARSFLKNYDKDKDYKQIRDPTKLYDRYEASLE